MLDPVTTPLLILVLGAIAENVIQEACKDFLKDRLKTLFNWLGTLGGRNDLEAAFEAAMKDAYGLCLELLLKNIAANGYSDAELRAYGDSLKKFVKDAEVATTLLDAIKNPDEPAFPSADVLARRWATLGCLELPGELWNGTAAAFRRQAKKQAFLNESLRQVLNARNLDAIRSLLERDGGVRPEVRQDKYSARMRNKYAPIDLANLMPSYAENPGQLVIRDVFVPQNVKENPPLVELPKDLEQGMHEGTGDADGQPKQGGDTLRDKLSAFYAVQAPQPVLDVIANPDIRLVMLVGDPGSGKSTLLRYLLLGILESPCEALTGLPLKWTECFRKSRTFPLLIELRDFYAAKRTNDDVDSFLDYALYLGRTEQYFLDDQWLDSTLQSEPSVVMFDGLDEIFDRGDRERVTQEIAGFAMRYPRTRVIVTSRQVGYRDGILRQAGFKHFGLQDLNPKQIEEFTRGWFRLTFPRQVDLATQRIDRVLASLKSPSVLLLAGNPMLLTIMALLAREQELPRERAAFYDAAVNVLCHHWDANRNLTLPTTEYLRVDDKKELLRRVAMRMQTGKGGLAGNTIQENALEEEVSAWFVDRFKQTEAEAIRSARLMIGQLRERNYVLCLRGPGLYGFVHRTFLEFLTATEYVAQFKDAQSIQFQDLWNVFDAHCRDSEWREVLRLIAAQINENFCQQLVERLANRARLDTWDGNTPRPELPLAIYCMSEARNLSKLEGAGAVLMQAVIAFVTKCNRVDEPARLLIEFLESELLPATAEIGTTWPGKNELERVAVTQLPQLDEDGRFVWPRLVANVVGTPEPLYEMAAWDDPTPYADQLRATALQTIVERWPSGATRAVVSGRLKVEFDDEFRSEAVRFLRTLSLDEESREQILSCALNDESAIVRAAALWELSVGWPDASTREVLSSRAVDDTDSGARSTAIKSLVERWPDAAVRELLFARANEDVDGTTRRRALESLANVWPDAAARELISERAMADNDSGVRASAIRSLSRHWPDLTTRGLLSVWAVEDADVGPRSAARAVLASKWPDENTRELVVGASRHDLDAEGRLQALQTLAKVWPDDTTAVLVRERGVEDTDPNVRLGALRLVAVTWPDAAGKGLLASSASTDGDAPVRQAAIQSLVSSWTDATVRDLLVSRASDDTDDGVRVDALRLLARGWRTEETRELLVTHALTDSSAPVRQSALGRLSSGWPTEQSLRVLAAQAVTDPDYGVRRSALKSIVAAWPLDSTRDLLRSCAAADANPEVRIAAVRALASDLGSAPTRTLFYRLASEEPDATVRSEIATALAESREPETRQVLRMLAAGDSSDEVRVDALGSLMLNFREDVDTGALRHISLHGTSVPARGCAASILGSVHSTLGSVIFTISGDGTGPYLDPNELVPTTHIVRTARRCGIVPSAIDSAVTDLSAHLGWDLTLGAKPTRL